MKRQGKLSLAIVLMIAIFASLFVSAPAQAAITSKITITNTSGYGVNMRPAPNLWGAPVGKIPEGSTNQKYLCYTRGTNVGGTDLWFRVKYGGVEGYYTSFYDDVPVADQTDLRLTSKYGIVSCGTTGQKPAQTWPSRNTTYNRQAAVNWALSNAQSLGQPNTFSGCTWFASQALWAGGFTQSETWNKVYSHGRLPGTVSATAAPELAKYLVNNYSVKQVDLNGDRFKSNSVPEAKVGDIIAYVWNDGGGGNKSITLDKIDHLSVVTSISSGSYPNVSEWGTGWPEGYKSRGWTWSENSHDWFRQMEKTKNVHAILLHFNF